MASDYKLIKYFNSFKGLDLDSSDLDRPDERATEALNADVRDSKSLNKRVGYHGEATEGGGFGIFKFANKNVDTGSITEEILAVDSNLKRKISGNITITYAGINVAQVHLYLHTDNKFYLDLYDDGVVVLNQDLGVGINEASPFTMAALKTEIDLIADFSAVITGTSTVPAAFLELNELTTISGSQALSFNEWETVPGKAFYDAFHTTQTHKNDEDFTNATAAQVNDVLYIATGYDELHKYDGQNCYAAGMPEGDNDYFTDRVISDKGSLYKATVNGTQNNVTTITVNNPHTLTIGDNIWCYDTGTSKHVRREVIEVTDTTVKVDSALVSIVNGAILTKFAFNTGISRDRQDIKYKLTYEMLDNKGNIIEGDISSTGQSITTTFVESLGFGRTYYDHLRDLAISFKIKNIYGGTKYLEKTGSFITSGTSLNAFTLSGGSPEFDIGDNIFFLDSNGDGVDAKITNIVGNVVTFDGDPVDLNGVRYPYVSAGLKINIWRNRADNSDSFYLLDTVPNYANSATQVYVDTTPDAARLPAFKLVAIDTRIQFFASGTLVIKNAVEGTTNILTEGVDWTITPGDASTSLTSLKNAIEAVTALDFLTVTLSHITNNQDGMVPASAYVLMMEANSQDVEASEVIVGLTNANYAFEYINEIYRPTGAGVSIYSWFQGTEESLLNNAQYEAPIKPHSIPPTCHYVTMFRNQLILAGDRENPNTVYYADIDGNEYFPEFDNAFDVDTILGDIITGIAPLRTALIVFKGESLHAVSGDIAQDSFRVDPLLNSKIGCLSHHSIQDVNGSLFFLTKKGIYTMDSASMNPQLLNGGISPLIDAKSPGFLTAAKRAVAVHWTLADKYLLFLPVEQTTTNKHDLSTSRVFAYDYAEDSWFEWTNIDFGGGVVELNDDLFFTEKRLGTQSGSVEHYTYKMSDTGFASAYADHQNAISLQYKTNWFSGDEPSIFKKFLRIQLFATETRSEFESDTFTITVKTENDFISTTKTNVTLDFDDSAGSYYHNKKTKLASVKARAMRIVFENSTLNENILLSGFELEIVAPYKSGVKE